MQGDPVHGEVSSADASGGISVSLFTGGGAAAARTVASSEFLTITDIIFLTTAGGDAALVADSDAAGKRIFKHSDFEVKGGVAHSFSIPWECAKGVTPKLIAAAGQVDLTITGFITKV